jgi:hypothetical protein
LSTFKIERPFEPYAERRASAYGIAAKIIGIVGIVGIVTDAFVLKSNLETRLVLLFFFFFTASFIFYTAHRKAYLFQQKIEVEESFITITHYIKDQLFTVSDPISSVQIQLKNTTTKSGFDCEVILRMKGQKFRIENNGHWTHQDLRDLFLHVKASKNEKPSHSETSTLSKIRDYTKR